MSSIHTLETKLGVRHAYSLGKVTNIECGAQGGVTLHFMGGSELALGELTQQNYEKIVKDWKNIQLV